MAEHGARVVISSRKADACDAVAAASTQAQGADAPSRSPPTSRRKDELKHLVDETTRQLRPDRHRWCATRRRTPTTARSAASRTTQFRKILENNVIANHWLINFAVPADDERREGSIIIVSSIGGLRGSPVIGAYNVSKAADLQLARNLAVEYGPHNVRVNCIAPGLIKTDFARALWEDPRRCSAAPPARRCGASASPTRSPARRSSWPRSAGAFMTGQSHRRRRRRHDLSHAIRESDDGTVQALRGSCLLPSGACACHKRPAYSVCREIHFLRRDAPS